MSALGRLKSGSWRDKLFGFLYYSMLISIPVIGWFCITNFLKYHENAWLFILTCVVFFIAINIPVLVDYCNTRKIHKGTIDYFLGEINTNKFNNRLSRHIHRITQKQESEPVFLIISVVLYFCLMFSSLMYYSINEYSIFMPFSILWFIFPCLTLFLHSNFINSQIVSVEHLNLIFEMDEITEDEKRSFSHAIKQIISSKGYVTRNDVFRHSDFIVKNNEMRKLLSKKQKNKEHYSSFVNRSG